MTYFQLKKYIASSLADVAGEYASYEAEKTVCHLYGIDRRTLLLRQREDAPDKTEETENIIARRKNGEPLAYIIEKTDFFGLELYVNSSCLTPRAETEVIVEKALELIGSKKADAMDICTGSGCIALAVAANSESKVHAVDISEKALAVAKRNAEKCMLSDKVSFEICDALSEDFSHRTEKYDIIVSNPPYIPTGDIASLSDEVHHEPMLALDGGSDGLIFYRRFIEILPRMLNPGGAIVFEIGYDQEEDLRALCAEASLSCEIFRDYGGNVRGAVIKPR